MGDALVALKHDELKEMGVASVGHRLTILKSIYETKVKQDIPIDPDHYIPLCKFSFLELHTFLMPQLAAEQNSRDELATQDDIQRIIQSIKLRDERIVQAEQELRKLADDYRRLREELLPVFKIAKDRSHPLPYGPPSSYQPSTTSPELSNHDTSIASPPVTQAAPEKTGSSLTRTFSKKLFLGSTPKNNSPTHVPNTIHEGKSLNDSSSLDPSAAAVAASSHLTASMSGGSQPSTSPNPMNVPSPTSPASFYPQQTLASRSYAREGTATNTSRTLYDHAEDLARDPPTRTAPTPTPQTARNLQDPPTSANSVNSTTKTTTATQGSSTDSAAPSVEIFKSFRVSMEDPCYKVLPAALKKYNIVADWRQYALYIVFGDQERCLGLEEKPLILFKKLDREGRKPMFMLRRHAPPSEGYTGHIGGSGAANTSFEGDGGAGLNGGGALGSSGSSVRGQQSAIQLPGGVL